MNNQAEQKSGLKIWIARDADGRLNIFTLEPEYEGGGWSVCHDASAYDVWYRARIDDNGEGALPFPSILPGQCRAARIELEALEHEMP